jgi:hypothetical protein
VTHGAARLGKHSALGVEPSASTAGAVAMRIKDPLIELLAIKLYEHDHASGCWPERNTTWMKLDDEDRELYRDIARGKTALGD